MTQAITFKPSMSISSNVNDFANTYLQSIQDNRVENIEGPALSSNNDRYSENYNGLELIEVFFILFIIATLILGIYKYKHYHNEELRTLDESDNFVLIRNPQEILSGEIIEEV